MHTQYIAMTPTLLPRKSAAGLGNTMLFPPSDLGGCLFLQHQNVSLVYSLTLTSSLAPSSLPSATLIAFSVLPTASTVRVSES
jgi:hypothetical protein